VFLACKSELRDYDGVMSDFSESLRLLKTDHIDLYQLHAVTTDEDVDRILSKNGALKAFLELRDKGVIRYIGFSAHTEEAALRLLENFDFDTILFPFNWVTWNKDDFGEKLMSVARERNLGILALKALAKRALAKNEKRAYPKAWYYPVETFEEAQKALRFTLTLPVTAAVTPGHEKFFDWACEIADDYSPITDEELKELKEKASELTPIFPEN
jgi:aryl-alcohol dehydrogenase-like predicted oxidoreductase